MGDGGNNNNTNDGMGGYSGGYNQYNPATYGPQQPVAGQNDWYNPNMAYQYNAPTNNGDLFGNVGANIGGNVGAGIGGGFAGDVGGSVGGIAGGNVDPSGNVSPVAPATTLPAFNMPTSPLGPGQGIPDLISKWRTEDLNNPEMYKLSSGQNILKNVAAGAASYFGSPLIGGVVGLGGKPALEAYNKYGINQFYDKMLDEQGRPIDVAAGGTPAANPAGAGSSTGANPFGGGGGNDIASMLAMGAMGMNTGGQRGTSNIPAVAAPQAATAAAPAAAGPTSPLANNPYYQEQLGQIESQYRNARDAILASGTSGGNLDKQMRELEYSKQNAIQELQGNIYQDERDKGQQTSLANLSANTTNYGTNVSAQVAREQLKAAEEQAEAQQEAAALNQMGYALGSMGGDK